MINPSLDHCIWIRDKGIVFIYIPKVACTSWKLYLWQLLGNELTSNITYKTVHNGQALPLPYVSRMGKSDQEDFRQRLNNTDLEVCAVIREPKARVLSGYLDKILNHRNPESSFSRLVIPAIRDQQQIEELRRPTFLEFLEWNCNVDRMKKEPINDHWRPMHKIFGIKDLETITDNRINIWDIKKLDKATAWFKQRFNRTVSFPSSQRLGPRPTNNSETKLEEYYGKSEIEVFDRLYNFDTELYRAVKSQ